MRKLHWQNHLLAVLVVYVLVFLVVSFIPEEDTAIVVDGPKAPAEIYGREDLQSREEYERQMLVNPTTGDIPYNIKKDELAFAKRRYQEQLLNAVPKGRANSQNTTATSNLTWTQVGPENFGGRTRAMALDVRDENTILAGGVSGGMWKSTNFGASWTKTTTNDQIQSVTAIAQDIRNGQEDVWYYGTGELVGNSSRAGGAPFRGDGIYKSTDNGLTWTILSSTASNAPGSFISPFQYVWDIVTDPSSTEDVVIAAVFGGIVRSNDGGQTWTTVLGADLLNIPPGSDLNDSPVPFYTDVHRTEDNVFYATLSSATNDSGNNSPIGGIYRSIDGTNWVQIRAYGSEFIRRTEIGSSPADTNLAYFIADGGTGYRLFRYNSSTDLVTDISSNLPDGRNPSIEEFDSQNSYNLFVKLHPNDANVVFAGGTNLYRSTDGFLTDNAISWIGGYDPSNPNDLYENHHPDQHELIFIPSDPNRMLSANDGGVFLSNDNRANVVTYESLNNGFITTQYYTVAMSQLPNEDVVFGGTQDNGSIVVQNAPIFDDNGVRIIGGDGGFAATTPFGFYEYLSFQNSRIFRLTLNDQFQLTSFARVDPAGGAPNPSQPYLFINPYVLDANNANRMYLAGGDAIWRNRNVSQLPSGSQEPPTINWDRLDATSIQRGQITALQTSTQGKNRLYYGTSTGRLFKIINANIVNYSLFEVTGSNFPENGYVRSIAVDPRNAEHVVVAFSNYQIPSIFQTTDGGNTYVDVSGNLEENPDGSGNGPSVRWITIVPQTDGTNFYLAGTSTGLYTTEELNGANTVWTLESPDGISNSIVNMIDYRRVDGKVAIATHGRGVFTSQIPDVEPYDTGTETESFQVISVAPNPFGDFVAVTVVVPENRLATARIYDLSGRLVNRISNAVAFAGENEFFWNGNDADGSPAPDGIYLFRITYGGQSKVEKVILQRN